MKKKSIIIWTILLLFLMGYPTETIVSPEQCSMCADLSRHAPCIINLCTGEKLELDVYKPHPFLVGEIVEEQPDGCFSLVRGAGATGYKVGGEFIVVTIPVESDRMNQQLFCNSCLERLVDEGESGYILADLKNPGTPVVYPINTANSIYVRDYRVSIRENPQNNEYEITVTGDHA